jgi:hypothetical protein
MISSTVSLCLRLPYTLKRLWSLTVLRGAVCRMSTSRYESATWPAPPEQLSAAREFLSSIAEKKDRSPILLIPDRDADGLASGSMMHRVLSRVILKDRDIPILTEWVEKGGDVTDPQHRALIESTGARYLLWIENSHPVTSLYWIRGQVRRPHSLQLRRSSLSTTMSRPPSPKTQ